MEHEMEYKYSSIVDPSTYETHGLCDGIPLRCHQQPELEEIETLRCQEDWRKWVSPLGFYKGGLGPRWNFMAITVPECLPERLGVLGYANELAFLHDDITDVVSVGDEHNDDLKATFEELAKEGKVRNIASGKRAIQAHIACEMLKLHKEQAVTTMKAWAKFADLGSGRHHDTRFETEAEYTKYRMVDIGTMFWYGMITFGMAISIPEKELDLAHDLASVAYLNLGLTNDLYSYQKEYETAMAMGQDYVVNLIWVLMKENSISEEQAKELCRNKIKQTIIDFRKIVADTNVRSDVSEETKRYLEGLLYSLSGNLVWSIDCPRYHSWSSYNERQLDWMKNGIPKSAGSPVANYKIKGGSNGHDNDMANGAVGSHRIDTTPAAHGGHALSGNGMIDTGLVNVFATKTVNDLKKMRIADEGTSTNDADGNIQPSGVHLTNDPEPILLDSSTVIEAPYVYLSSLPSKNVREKAIDALNIWFRVPADKLERIQLITKLLHNASLMLDDIEDDSCLRRGSPSTHTIFGVAQTINAANYQILRALEEAQKFGDRDSLAIFSEELKNLYMGQGLDLYWVQNQVCPSIDQYLRMVQGKTGGLFRLLGRLLATHASNTVEADLTKLLNDVGQYFQIRDDYQNITSPEYTKQKGFAEDLDEGKYSLPLIHLISTNPSDPVLQNILAQRCFNRGLSVELKQLVLGKMEARGSLVFTSNVLKLLHARIETSIDELESSFGVENSELRLLIALLEI
ncbi:putative geranylgeranyl diphosphate synthase [Xylaria palmicola]|nr:putative geranylgeranyl diphosphate synthase [Xylaria palmicola]